jgi:hypothetical protein
VRSRLGVIAALAALALPVAAARAADPVGFSQPQYIDKELAGGEPLLWNDPLHHTLLYTSHEGTTHLYQPGLLSAAGDFQFISNYRNQVILWLSKDDGATWTRVNYMGTGFRTDPTENTGFSDPDFTQDAGGRIYDTGIDLANDALFSTADGGLTWDRGTIQCNDGDRPWLAGGVKDEVFMATDTAEDGGSDPTGTGHAIFQSTDGGETCQKAATDYGATSAGGAEAYVGYGKLYMDHARQRLIEPELYQKHDSQGNAKTIGIGVGTWQRGQSQFTPHFIASTTLQGHFPSIALDPEDNVYLVWDTDPRDPQGKGGCNGNPTPLANQIMLAVSKDWGQTWSTPVAVASPGARALWPWAVAGDSGKLNVVWYQSDKVNDPDCAPADAKWTIYDAQVSGADNPGSMTEQSGPVSPVIHRGGICQGGTTCVATGQDRRLGDFFTNTTDARGCTIIASGDTRLTDDTGGQLPTSRPIFIRQTSGPALAGDGQCGSGTAARSDSSYVLGSRKAHHRRSTCATHRRRHHKRHAARSAAKHKHPRRHTTCKKAKHHHRRHTRRH